MEQELVHEYLCHDKGEQHQRGDGYKKIRQMKIEENRNPVDEAACEIKPKDCYRAVDFLIPVIKKVHAYYQKASYSTGKWYKGVGNCCNIHNHELTIQK